MRMRIFSWFLALPALFLVGDLRAEVVERPDDVEALPVEWLDKVEHLTAEAVRWRGLEAGETLPAGVQGEAALEQRLGQLIYEQLPDEVADAAERTLKVFGLIPDDMDLRAFYQELMTEQVAGYFDPATEYLVMVDRGTDTGVEGGTDAENEMMSMMDDAILVHEIGHYLQHRHFDLGQMLESEEIFSDAALARVALTEGDATLVMYSHMMGVALEKLPTLDSIFEEMAENPAQLVEMSPDLPPGEEMANAPAYIRDGMIFPYFQGFVFTSRLRQAGGQKLLDYAFRTDHPKSSEQILHPEKWISERDEPVILELPDFSKLLPGYKLKMAGTWGELSSRIILSEAGLGFEMARSAAYGWGGDRFALLTKGRRELVVWVTEWDSAAEAREFSTAARKVLKDWHQWQDRDATRVVLVHGDLRPKRLARLGAALWAAPGQRLPAQNIELAALGITDEDLPQPVGPEEIEQMMSSGLGMWLDESELPDLEEIMQDPAAQQELQTAFDSLSAEDLQELRDSDAIRSLLENIERPVGRVTPEGRFAIEKVGFSMALPDAATWQPAEPAMAAAMASEPQMLWRHEAANANLAVVAIHMPMPITLPTVVASIKMTRPVPNFEVRRSQEIESSQPAGHFLWYTGGEAGNSVESLNRYYVVDGHMVTVQATVFGEMSPEIVEEIDGIFESIEFTAVAATTSE